MCEMGNSLFFFSVFLGGRVGEGICFYTTLCLDCIEGREDKGRKDEGRMTLSLPWTHTHSVSQYTFKPLWEQHTNKASKQEGKQTKTNRIQLH
jgi:hypothetical protein